MASSAPVAQTQVIDQSDVEKAQQQREQILKIVSQAFLTMRAQITESIIDPSLGTVDDLTITWQCARLSEEAQKEYMVKNKIEDEAKKPTKDGKLHLTFYTLTTPTTEGTQLFKSFSVDSVISFTDDDHPVLAKKKAEEIAAAVSPKVTEATPSKGPKIEVVADEDEDEYEEVIVRKKKVSVAKKVSA